MKVCPKCNSSYSDETLVYCLTDGAALVNKKDLISKKTNSNLSEEEKIYKNINSTTSTIEGKTKTTISPKSSSSITYTVLGVLLIGILVSGGFWWYSQNKVSSSNTSSTGLSGTPTEAYKKLYDAVKAKNVEATKSVMSKQTLGFAESVAQRQNVSLDKVFENGFTATTFSPSMPEIRDERVKDGFGSVEVYNSKDKRWEDLPFVMEDGNWKLAVGDLFANTFKSPGKGRSVLEMEAANASGNSPMTVVNTNGMGNFKSGERLTPRETDNLNPTANANLNANTKTAANSAK